MLRPSDPPGEHGFTLVELVVAAAIVGVVIAAIAAAFVLSFRTTADATDRMAQAADAQLLATYWPADVASLDATGADAVPTCGSSNEIVTFAWNLSGELGGSETRVTYSAEGAGPGSEVVRHRCVGDSTAPVDSTVVASNFGARGSSALASTWIAGPGGTGSAGCDERVCTIHLKGTYEFEVTARRRVPGEVPG
jgi:prepilin-type N-terminal cleavage/methylation domain-containing protein